jgi:hypothetical protein
MPADHRRFYGPPMPGRYEIRVQGHLTARWVASFEGCTLTHDTDGTTVISRADVDQAALHGLLRRVRDVGLPLVSVVHVDTEPPDRAPRSLR